MKPAQAESKAITAALRRRKGAFTLAGKTVRSCGFSGRMSTCYLLEGRNRTFVRIWSLRPPDGDLTSLPFDKGKLNKLRRVIEYRRRQLAPI